MDLKLYFIYLISYEDKTQNSSTFLWNENLENETKLSGKFYMTYSLKYRLKPILT